EPVHLAPRVTAAVGDEQRVACVVERLLDAMDDVAEERVGEVAHDEADGPREAAAQALRPGIGRVAELLRGGEHLGLHGGAHIRVGAERTGDRGHRDAGLRRDVVDRDSPCFFHVYPRCWWFARLTRMTYSRCQTSVKL